jgi:hypothetical protein
MTSSNSAAANKALVSKVMDAVFVRRDSSVVERHFDKGYILQEEVPASSTANGNPMFSDRSGKALGQ